MNEHYVEKVQTHNWLLAVNRSISALNNLINTNYKLKTNQKKIIRHKNSPKIV